MKHNPLHPITGLAATFAHRLLIEARLRAAAKRNAFPRNLAWSARLWFSSGKGGAS